MPSLRRRFRWFNAALKLYPRRYYRQNSTQILQTLADLVYDAALSQSKKTKLHLKAWLDLLRSISKQRLLAAIKKYRRQPGRWLRRHTLLCSALFAPLLLVILITHFTGPSATPFDSFWDHRLVIDMISLVLPTFATILALYAVGMWVIGRGYGGRLRSRLAIIWLAAVVVIGIAGLGFLTVIGIGQYTTQRQLERETAISMRYQQAHPTLACQLLPVQAAQRIMAPIRVNLNNSHFFTGNPNSGVTYTDKDVQTTNCLYVPKNYIDYGLSTSVHQTLTSAGQTSLKQQFDNPQTNYGQQKLSILGYDGYYAIDDYSFNLRLWVDNCWLEITTKDFKHGIAAMQTMIGNLQQYLARQAAAQEEAAQQKLPIQPLSADQLSDQDRSQISQLLVDRDLQPAGTTYTVSYDTIAGQRISGTIAYANSIRASYSAERAPTGWTIVRYQRQ